MRGQAREQETYLTIMPALKAFGLKWRIGSDDFVFPYTLSAFIRSIWFVSIGFMLVSYDNEYHCNDESLLKIYLLILLGVHIMMCIVEIIIVLFSARGTIADPQPRAKLTWLLYIKTLLFFAELIWDCVGVVWAFDPTIDCPASHKMLIFVRIVLIWNLFSTVVVVLYMSVRIGVCGLCCRRTPRKLRYESQAPKTTYQGRRLSRVSSTALGHHTRQRTWQWRLQCLFCCLRLRSRQREVFSEVSAALSDACRKFRGYVPSDVLAGMALISMEQRAKRRHGPKKEILRTSSRSDVNFDDRGIQTHFNKTLKYLEFASAAYGWSYHVSSRGIIGLLTLMFSCCRRKKEQVDEDDDDYDDDEVEDISAPAIKGDNICGWSKMVIKRYTGCKDQDILHATFNSEVYCPAFYVVADHDEEAIVVTIRGTMSLGDTLTDFSAQPGLLMVNESIKYYAHKGMINAAEALRLKLEGEGILHRAFNRYPSYRLVITGHSMGGGCASLLAMLLYSTYPKLHCFAYAPPGGVVSLSAVSYTRRFITTVVLGNDLVPRLSLQNVEALGERVLYKMQTSTLPKYRIFLRSFLQWVGVSRPGKPSKDDWKRIAGRESEEVLLQQTVDAEMNEVDPVTGKSVLQPIDRHDLYLPGRIVHLQWEEKKCCCLARCNKRPITSQWTAQSEFSELFLDNDMVKDHMPYSMLKAMKALKEQECI